jgi:CheY-like chemotaxis protein
VSILPSDKINFANLSVVLVDDNSQALDILASVVSGFGARGIVRCDSAEAAREHLARNTVDIIITDAQMPGSDGYELVHWIRRSAAEANRFIPVVIVTAHTRKVEVLRARDCGANFIVAKPITPKVLLERIVWIAKEDRMAVETSDYVGPDRRFQNLGPPPDKAGRRSGDLSAEVGIASEPNMSQEEIDALMNPKKKKTAI